MQMRPQEKEKEQTANRSIFPEQMKIIIVRIDRVLLHSLGAKQSAVIEIGAAPSSDERRCFPFFNRSMPEVEPNLRGIQRILGAVGKEVAFLDHHYRRTADN